ncbi:MAG TPA: hypothetical protein VF284_06870 [Rhodanobacteraceae bacterium]
MEIRNYWIAYFIHYATGEGMHFVMAVADSAGRAEQLYEERAPESRRGQSTTAPLTAVLEQFPDMRAVIPDAVRRRFTDPLCSTLEYFATVDFDCA